MVRTSLALVLALLSACVTSRLGPGVLRKDWQERPRDPDPMHNPAAQERDNRWTDERDERIRGPGEAQPEPAEEADGAGEDSPAVDLAKRSVATFLAWSVAGWLPLVEASGTFEEDPATRKLHRQRIERAARDRDEQKQKRVERAEPATDP